ncbi:uncharacterized protein LOC108095243 [Drosophila ficusphila]|uniref:uncharacterized protein LOC108095243 n=1 Tax=Drosophila ficusphila TaxID=30025 RepID=UPI0007E75BD2|nr:uncharacterized protein LOC108095243 [Drosophila ficusphila]
MWLLTLGSAVQMLLLFSLLLLLPLPGFSRVEENRRYDRYDGHPIRVNRPRVLERN